MHTLYKNFKHKIVYRRHEWTKLLEKHEGNTVRENSFAWKMCGIVFCIISRIYSNGRATVGDPYVPVCNLR